MARTRVLMRDCRARAAEITRQHNITLRIDARTGQPRLFINEGMISEAKWLEIIPPQPTGSFMVALDAFAEGIEVGRRRSRIA